MEYNSEATDPSGNFQQKHRFSLLFIYIPSQAPSRFSDVLLLHLKLKVISVIKLNSHGFREERNKNPTH